MATEPILVKPRDLPAQGEVYADDAIPTDNGVTVGRGTPVQIVNAGAPVASQSEAIAGVDNAKRMTALRVRQVLDNEIAPAVLRAQAWAESPTNPNPGDPTSKSSKTWAELAMEYSVLAGFYFEQSDADMAFVAISDNVNVIQRRPLSESPGQVAPLGELTWWARTEGPTVEPYFVTAGGVIWTQTGPRIREWISAVNSAIMELATSPELFGAQPFDSLAAFNAATIPASVNRVSVTVGQVPGDGVMTVGFVRSTGTTISGLKPGWVPDGDWRPEHFGAVRNLSSGSQQATNMAAINAALAAMPLNGVLVFAVGVYYTNDTIVVSRRVGLRGAGIGRTTIQCSSLANSVLRFAPPNSATQFLDAPSFEGIGLVGGNGGTTAVSGYALEIIRCNGGKFKSFRFNGCANGILVAGGQDNRISDFAGWGRFGGTMIAGSSLFESRGDHWDGGFQAAYQCEVMDFRLSGHSSMVVEDVLKITCADGLHFTGGYINYGARSLIRWDINDPDQGVAGVSFTNVYFDGVKSGGPGSDHFMTGAAHGSPRTLNARFVNCHIGNFDGALFDLPVDFGLGTMIFSACRFTYAAGGGGIIKGNADAVLQFDECTATRIDEKLTLDTFAVIDCDITFADCPSAAELVRLDGTIRQKALALKFTSTATGGFLDTSTGENRFVEYDWQQVGVFTPEFRIDNDATGITTSVSTGEYVTIGDLVWARGSIRLSSKGLNTGELRISGLPFTNLGGNTPVKMRVFATPNNAPPISGYIPNSSQSILLNKWVLNGDAPMIESDVNDNTAFHFSVIYRRR